MLWNGVCRLLVVVMKEQMALAHAVGVHPRAVSGLTPVSVMYLMYYLSDKGERVYTMAKVDPSGKPTISAHPGKWTEWLSVAECLTRCPCSPVHAGG